MRIRDPEIVESPMRAGSIRVRARVQYDTGSPGEEVYWFDVPAGLEDHLSCSANPWVACCAPLAVSLRQPLQFESRVDPYLLRNVRELMHVWAAWYPEMEPVPVTGPTPALDADPDIVGRIGALFSGGVDSLFSLVTHNADGREIRVPGPTIDEALFVWGFDVSLSNEAGFRRIEENLSSVAERFGADFVPVATNLFRTRWAEEVDWGRHGHGSALASVGLVLEERFDSVLIPASYTYDRLFAWGSHPLTDPLHSTSTLEIVHDGAAYDRTEKTALLVREGPSVSSVRVCWESGSSENCGECAKRYRTMANLEVLGALESSPAFDRQSISPWSLARIYAPEEHDRVFLEEIRDRAYEEGRVDLAWALWGSVLWTHWVNSWLRCARWLNRRRGV